MLQKIIQLNIGRSFLLSQHNQLRRIFFAQEKLNSLSQLKVLSDENLAEIKKYFGEEEPETKRLVLDLLHARKIISDYERRILFLLGNLNTASDIVHIDAVRQFVAQLADSKDTEPRSVLEELIKVALLSDEHLPIILESEIVAINLAQINSYTAEVDIIGAITKLSRYADAVINVSAEDEICIKENLDVLVNYGYLSRRAIPLLIRLYGNHKLSPELKDTVLNLIDFLSPASKREVVGLIELLLHHNDDIRIKAIRSLTRSLRLIGPDEKYLSVYLDVYTKEIENQLSKDDISSHLLLELMGSIEKLKISTEPVIKILEKHILSDDEKIYQKALGVLTSIGHFTKEEKEDLMDFLKVNHELLKNKPIRSPNVASIVNQHIAKYKASVPMSAQPQLTATVVSRSQNPNVLSVEEVQSWFVGNSANDSKPRYYEIFKKHNLEEKEFLPPTCENQGKYIYIRSARQNQLHIFDRETLEMMHSLEHSGEFYYNKDESRLYLLANHARQIRIIDTKNWKDLYVFSIKLSFQKLEYFNSVLLFAHDLEFGAAKKFLTVNLASGSPVFTTISFDQRYLPPVITHDGNYLIFRKSYSKNKLIIYGEKNNEFTFNDQIDVPCNNITVSPDSRKIFTYGDGYLYIYELGKKVPPKKLLSKGAIAKVEFLNNTIIQVHGQFGFLLRNEIRYYDISDLYNWKLLAVISPDKDKITFYPASQFRFPFKNSNSHKILAKSLIKMSPDQQHICFKMENKFQVFRLKDGTQIEVHYDPVIYN